MNRLSDDDSIDNSSPDNPEEEEESSKERRGWKRERRVIKRFSDGRLKAAYLFIHSGTGFLTWLAFIAALTEFGFSLSMNNLSSGALHIFYGFFFILMGYFLSGYKSKLKSYLENESASNLAETVERQKTIWLIICVFCILLYLFQLTQKVLTLLQK